MKDKLQVRHLWENTVLTILLKKHNANNVYEIWNNFEVYLLKPDLWFTRWNVLSSSVLEIINSNRNCVFWTNKSANKQIHILSTFLTQLQPILLAAVWQTAMSKCFGLRASHWRDFNIIIVSILYSYYIIILLHLSENHQWKNRESWLFLDIQDLCIYKQHYSNYFIIYVKFKLRYSQKFT